MDLLINNAVAVDLDTGRETKCAVWIEKGRIQGLSEPLTGERADTAAEILLVAGGAYILPGLIDFHTHLYTRGSGFGLNGDLLLSSGVTMAVDMGTAGCAGYEAFRLTDILPRTINIRSFLNLSPVGQPGAGISEPLDRAAVKEGLMEELITKYADEIRGIKVRISRSIVGDLGIAPLEHALELGERWKLPVCVHTTDPPVRAEEIVSRLRPGDIYSHMYHNKGMTILKEDGGVQEAFKKAQKRGVILEVGNGRMNFNFEVAQQAVRDGVYPDIISSDATAATFANTPAMKDLAFVMSKFWNMGMPLHRVFDSVTRTPARCLGMEKQAGILKKGRSADLTILKVCEQDVEFSDSDGNVRKGTSLLVPVMTALNGKIVYLQGDIRLRKKRL